MIDAQGRTCLLVLGFCIRVWRNWQRSALQKRRLGVRVPPHVPRVEYRRNTGYPATKHRSTFQMVLTRRKEPAAPPARDRAKPTEATGRFGKLRGNIRDIIAELRKVTWP